MTLRTLHDVRKLLGHILKERRQLSTWQHVETTLRSGDSMYIAVALKLVFQLENVPYTLGD